MAKLHRDALQTLHCVPNLSNDFNPSNGQTVDRVLQTVCILRKIRVHPVLTLNIWRPCSPFINASGSDMQCAL